MVIRGTEIKERELFTRMLAWVRDVSSAQSLWGCVGSGWRGDAEPPVTEAIWQCFS